MNPQTTEGIAAKSSMTTFSTSFTCLPQNSETKTAAPRPNGTASNIASVVTLNVPTMGVLQAEDRQGRPVLVFESDWAVRYTAEKNPKVDFRNTM